MRNDETDVGRSMAGGEYYPIASAAANTDARHRKDEPRRREAPAESLSVGASRLRVFAVLFHSNRVSQKRKGSHGMERADSVHLILNRVPMPSPAGTCCFRTDTA